MPRLLQYAASSASDGYYGDMPTDSLTESSGSSSANETECPLQTLDCFNLGFWCKARTFCFRWTGEDMMLAEWLTAPERTR